MSYTIEYNRQFIKTKNGYIPCWLHGDNNVTTGYGKNERRVRSWSVFMNWLDVTEDYMLEHIKENNSYLLERIFLKNYSNKKILSFQKK